MSDDAKTTAERAAAVARVRALVAGTSDDYVRVPCADVVLVCEAAGVPADTLAELGRRLAAWHQLGGQAPMGLHRDAHLKALLEKAPPAQA